MIRKVSYESQERREKQVLAALNANGIKSLEEANQICEDAGVDPYQMCEDTQRICFENAKWAYVAGAAIAIKKGAKTAAAGAHRSRHHPGQHSLPHRRRTGDRSLRRQLGAQHLLSGCATRLVSPTRLPRHRSHDRLLGVDFQSEVDTHRSRSPVWHLRSLHDSLGFRLRAQPGSRHRHHRRSRRPYSHLPVEQTQS